MPQAESCDNETGDSAPVEIEIYVRTNSSMTPTTQTPTHSTAHALAVTLSKAIHFIRLSGQQKETVQYIQYVYVYKMLLDMDYL